MYFVDSLTNLFLSSRRDTIIVNCSLSIVNFLNPLPQPGQHFLPAAFRQGEMAGGADFDIPIFPQQTDRAADARLGKTQVLGDVDGTNRSLAVLQDEDRLQIVFSGFLDFHGAVLLCVVLKCIIADKSA